MLRARDEPVGYGGLLVCPPRRGSCHPVANHLSAPASFATYTDPFRAVTMLASLSACRDDSVSLLACRRSLGIAHRSSLSCQRQRWTSLSSRREEVHFSCTMSHHIRHFSNRGSTRSWRSGVDPSSAGSFPSLIVA